MADLIDVQDWNAIVRANWADVVYDVRSPALPVLELFWGKYGDKQDPKGIGLIGNAALLTGLKNKAVMKADIMSATQYQPSFMYRLPNESDGVQSGFGSNSPPIQNYPTGGPEARIKRPTFKWFTAADPCWVDKLRVDHTTSVVKGETEGWEALISLIDEENKDRMAVHLERIDNMHHGMYTPADGRFSNLGYASNYSNETLDALDDFYTIAGGNGSYAGLDLTNADNATMTGNIITVATSPSARSMIRYANSQLFTDGSGRQYGLKRYGAQLDAILVGGQLFNSFMQEADAKSLTVVPARTPIPRMAEFGFNMDVILVDGKTVIVEDDSMPTGQAVGLNLSTFFYALHPDGAFEVSTPTFLGDRPGEPNCYYWWVRTQAMFGCLAPRVGIVLWTNVG